MAEPNPPETGQPASDSWSALEDAAFAAFSSYANPGAPGLVATLKRAVHYAQIDGGARAIVVDKRAFLFGLVSYGLLETPSTSFGNTASWIGSWIAGRAPSVRSAVQSGVTQTDELRNAFRDSFPVVWSRSMQALGGDAVRFADRTVKRTKADLRHLFAAFIQDAESPVVELLRLGWTASTHGVRLMRQELYDRIAKTPETSEDLAQWRRILLSAAPLELSGFSSDRPVAPALGDDPLDLLADVRSFARLICLEEAQPPLSIGLFGGWGSGKSTFMNLLELEVDEITANVRALASWGDAGGSSTGEEGPAVFISNALQVRFNAWHFADANLWASLTAEFFDQLRAGGYARSGKAIHTRLVERVNEHVHALTSEAATTRQALVESEEKLRKAQKKRDDAIKEAQQAPGEALKQTTVDAVTRAFQSHKADLRELGGRIGQDGADKDIDAFISLARSLRTAGGQAKSLLDFVLAQRWRTVLAVVGALAVAVSIGFIGYVATTSSSQFNPASLIGLVAGLGALARAVLPGVRIIADLIKSTSEFAADLDKQIGEHIKEVAKKEEALQRAAAETEARRAAAERASKALARYVEPNSAMTNPPRLLRFVLEDDPDTRALEKEIGLISRVCAARGICHRQADRPRPNFRSWALRGARKPHECWAFFGGMVLWC